eukprot:gene5563-11194_t
MSNHIGGFLAIDHRNKKVKILFTQNYKDGTGWFNIKDRGRIESIMKEDNLPSIILPINRLDSSISKSEHMKRHPMVGFCQKRDNIDILWPSSHYYGSFNVIDYTPNKNIWLSKENKAWFRGYFNGGRTKGRFTIVNESQSIPLLVDAKITQWEFPHQKQICQHLLGTRTPLQEITTKYRYIIDIDGNCAAMRLQELLGRNLVILKVRSLERQWFSSALLPWIHYVPIDLEPYEIIEQELYRSYRQNRTIKQRSNIKKLVQWLISHEDIAFEMIRAANLFYYDYLTLDAINCYIRTLVTELAKLYTFNVTEKIDNFNL